MNNSDTPIVTEAFEEPVKADPIKIVDIRDFLSVEIAGLSTMLESTIGYDKTLSDALENVLRRNQILGALSALNNIAAAIRIGDEAAKGAS
jgi:hypothetical protein